MRILTITGPDIENGLGWRVTVWVAGCSHHCPGCHNKHTWSYDQGTDLKEEIVWETLCKMVDQPYINGITLSGGDPLAQSEESLRDLDQFIVKFKNRFPEKTIWIYSGDVIENLTKDDVVKSILSKVDVLVDGPFIQEKFNPDIPFRGSTNQKIISNIKDYIK